MRQLPPWAHAADDNPAPLPHRPRDEGDGESEGDAQLKAFLGSLSTETAELRIAADLKEGVHVAPGLNVREHVAHDHTKGVHIHALATT